ncbi:hypothetical protein PG984_000398 [Apiospora sp. TS-2023a]
MTTEPSSPRRRHILSSINPDLPRLSPEQEDRADSYTAPLKSDSHHLPDDAGDERAHSKDPDSGNNDSKRHRDRKATKFRFKSKHSSSHRSSRRREREYDDDDARRHRDRDRDRDEEDRRPSKRSKEDMEEEGVKDDDDPDRESRRSHRRSHHSSEHHKHRRRRHRHRTRTRSPTPPNPHEPPPLDPEAAFRESLFDAMADDEGAAYWEGVYGQPIHVYANARPTEGGELEQMTEDEYAAYVRQKMWEKTHQGLLEERARREDAKKAKDDKEAEARRLTRQMEESLRRGEERRRRRSWRDKYEEYAAAWADWDGTLEGMSWPVARSGGSGSSGDRAEISSETVRAFFVNGLDPIEIGESVFLAKLKEERVRWHPDKIQQRLGPGFDEAVRRDVTAVFQIIDKLWSDIRAKAKAKT